MRACGGASWPSAASPTRGSTAAARATPAACCADEYLPQEQADNVTAIAWLAAQPWCNGAVGMRGVSWGGFSTLQAAALSPPALKAIMPMCASDRRYTDDAHYVGGAFALTGLKWATSFKAVMAGPPDPAVFGPGWEAEWMARLEAAPAIAAEWLRHQREDDYWRQGSVGFDPAAIRCPVYLVGGWIDPYNEMIPRLLERLRVPTKALIGPWQHGYPSPATPGPGLDWAFEEVRWWKAAPGGGIDRDHGRAAGADVPARAVGHRGGAGRDRRPLGCRARLAAGDGDAELAPERRSARVDGGAGGGGAPRPRRGRPRDAGVGPVLSGHLPAGAVGRRRRVDGRSTPIRSTRRSTCSERRCSVCGSPRIGRSPGSQPGSAR